MSVSFYQLHEMSWMNKTFFIIIIFGLLITYTYYFYNGNFQPPQMYRDFFAYKTETTCQETKYILYWTTAFGRLNFNLPTAGFEFFKKCKFKNCFVTYDRNILPIEKYDALLFHIPTKQIEESIPVKRSAHQRYVFVNREAPIRFNKDKKNVQYIFDDFFNWTMTYRLDSDLPRPYGYFFKRSQTNQYTMPTQDFIKGKTRSVAWFVSNCKSSNKREDLAAKLSKYIDVDVYGKCGNFTCDPSTDCHKMLEKNYKFYLAFENSICTDYVTEKLYDILSHDVVPIVYGGGNYRELAPPLSVIDAGDFENVESLADYLKFLVNNTDAYLKYFEWKKSYYIHTSVDRTLCQMCEMLNDPQQAVKSYDNIYEWWFGKNYSHCKTGDELPRIVLNI